MNAVQTIGVVVFNNNKVLLVKHTQGAEHMTGVYGLPSGRVEHGESLAEAAKRELREETGLVAEELVELPETYFAEIERKTGGKVPMTMTVFLCSGFSGLLHESDETVPEWIAIDKIGALPLLPNIEKAISEALHIGNK